MTASLEKPRHTEIELSLFGPGYGEAVLLHLGNGKWMMVDCCLDPNAGTPAPLRYLSDLGVDFGDVILIVATHWHDDHIRGISKALDVCHRARFCASGALQDSDLVEMLFAYDGRSAAGSTGVVEIGRVFSTLMARRDPRQRLPRIEFAEAGLQMIQEAVTSVGETALVSVTALSPSHSVRLQADIARYRPESGHPFRAVPEPTRNASSVALWVSAGCTALLLGADLERTGDPDTGWSAVVSDQRGVIDGVASAFKVPHHGAASAHCDEVWETLLCPEPYAVVSAFNNGAVHLPSEADVARMASRTHELFLAGSVRLHRPRFSDNVVSRSVRENTESFHSIESRCGQVRLRRDMLRETSSWEVRLFGDAERYA